MCPVISQVSELKVFLCTVQQLAEFGNIKQQCI